MVTFYFPLAWTVFFLQLEHFRNLQLTSSTVKRESWKFSHVLKFKGSFLARSNKSRLVLNLKSRLQSVQVYTHQTKHRQSRLQGFFILAYSTRETRAKVREEKQDTALVTLYGCQPTNCEKEEKICLKSDHFGPITWSDQLGCDATAISKLNQSICTSIFLRILKNN